MLGPQSDFQKWLGEKIWIVGSGSLDCFPIPGCHCQLCEVARKGGKDKRLCASSIFYKDCLFDLGSGIWERVKNKGVNPKAIILSHVHFDHIGDLIKWPRISREVPVYTSSINYSLFKKLGIKASYFQPNESFKPLPDLEIKTRPVIHTFTRPASLLKFNGILYAPDLGGLTDEDLKWCEGVKFWIGDGFSFEEDFEVQGEKLHQSMQKLLIQLKKLESEESVLFLGLGHHSKYPHEDLELYLKKFSMDENLPYLVEVGWDNQIIG